MSKKFKLLVFIFAAAALFVTGASFVHAQDLGINSVGSVINLSQQDPRVIVGRIIQIALSFLGVIAVVLMIYAGFMWMTSGGDEDRIAKAKKTLKNALIGLIIILMSWAIVTFILSRLMNAISGQGGDDLGGGGYVFNDPGISALGACAVNSVYPENGQTDVARNSAIIITFHEAVNIDSLCQDTSGNNCACSASCNRIDPEAIRIYKSDLGDGCSANNCPATNSNVTDVSVSVSSDKRSFVLTPLSYLGEADKHIWYNVKLTDNFKKQSDGGSVFKACGSDYFLWKFETGTKLDLVPPQVSMGGIFPLPDNDGDIANLSAAAKPAQGSITVNTCPNIYKPSAIQSVTPLGASPAASASPLNYKGNITRFKVVISSASKDKAQLFDGQDDKVLLGAADFGTSGQAKFDGYFTFTAGTRNAGDAWEVRLTPETIADTLTIGEETYTFSSAPSGNNNINVPATCNAAAQAFQIQAVLSGDPSVDVTRNGNKVELTAKVAGVSGNTIGLASTNQSALAISPLSGGSDKQDLSQVQDKRDTAMNTVVQINFNEAVNPLQVSGLASEVKDYIRIVNAEASSPAGAACTKDSDCRSYRCSGQAGNRTCAGDEIAGRFLVSNGYKTVEFVSDVECGVNGCGEKIYCLPASSHLAVELRSADLKSCQSDNDCLGYNPYRSCNPSPLGYKTCQNTDSLNYPTASSSLNGIIDTAINSFDGDRSISSEGPVAFYDDNFAPSLNSGKKDSYRWSFYVNDKIMLAPPLIEAVTPVQGSFGVNLADPIRIAWNTLMMNSTLNSGSRQILSGSSTSEHKLINLWSANPSAFGYWINNDNEDIAPKDNEPDRTVSWIKHSPFPQSLSFFAQAGSGIKDIYQNCFKPSGGANCPVTAANPSCCFGVATSSLDAEGNCR